VGFVLLDLLFYMYVLLIVVCPFVLFLLAILLSVLRYTVSDCPFWYLQTLFGVLASKDLNCMAFQYFNFDEGYLFQKRVVCTNKNVDIKFSAHDASLE